MTRLHLIPVLQDNYCYALERGGRVVLVDPGEYAPVAAWLDAHDLRPACILITHHHGDHTGGVEALRARYAPHVIGPAAERARLPTLDQAVEDGDIITILDGISVRVIATPGHTSGHICYDLPDEQILFSGDTLFSLGCGRLFEGGAQDLWDSLEKLRALPDETRVCGGHEYTLSNARFALHVDPDNAALRERAEQVEALRAENRPTLPAILRDERAANPFLRAKNVQELAALRRAKDQF